MRKNKQIIWIACILLGGFICTSCSLFQPKLPELTVDDGSVMTGEPCAAPCLQGITPGVTTKVEAVTILNRLGDFAKCDLQDENERKYGLDMKCANFAIGYNDQDIVKWIHFESEGEISVADLIEKYGEPDAYAVDAERIDSNGPILMYLMFTDAQMGARLPYMQPDGYLYNLQPSLIVQSFDYYDSRFYEEYVLTLGKEWQGYGEY